MTLTMMGTWTVPLTNNDDDGGKVLSLPTNARDDDPDPHVVWLLSFPNSVREEQIQTTTACLSHSPSSGHVVDHHEH